MPRVKDIAWKFVTRLEGEKWCCPYCETEYSGKVTRVKSHFLKHPNKGIYPCKKVPEHISMLMDWLHNQVHDKDDIAWKFVNRLEDNRWKCRYCSVEFSGDLTGVKGHLLKVPIEGISICTEVPDHIRKLMRSLLDEVAEEESREVAEERSREAHGQSSMEPKSRDMPTQVEVAEEERREANRQFSTGPQSRDMLPPAVFLSPQSSENMENLFTTAEGATDMANFTSDHQQGKRQLRETLPMLSLAQNSHGENSTMTSAEEVPYPLNLLYQSQCSIQSQMQMNDQQTLAGPSSCQYDQSPAVGNLTDSIPHFYEPLPSCHEAFATVTSSIPPEDPSSSQLQPVHQLQSVRHQSINHKTRNAQQNPTMSLDVAYDEITSSVPQLASLSLDPSKPQVHLDQPTHETGNEQYDQVLDNSTSNVPWKFTAVGITSHPSSASWSTLFNAWPESCDVNVNTSEEIQMNELHNPTAGLQNDSSLDVDSTNRPQDSQLCVVEVVPVLSRVSNTSPPSTVQHPNQLHPRCDKGDGNDTRLFPTPTPMNVEPSIVSPHSSNSHNFEATIDNLQVLEPATNTTGPSSSEAPVYPQHQSVTHQSETRNVLQNPTALTSTALVDMDSCIPSSSQAPNNAPHGPTGISNFNQQYVTGLYSGQQSQAERQFPQSSTMLSLVQNSHGDSTSCSTDALAEELSYLLASPHQPQCSFLSPCTVEMPMNGQQTPMGASSSQDNRSTSVGNSNCSQDCNKHSQLHTPMDIDPSIASQHTTDSHAIGTTIVDLQVPEVATNTIGPSSSQDMNRGSPIMNVRRTPQTCRWMEQEARAVDIANLPSDGATSYSSASSLQNSFFPNSLTLNAQQNPSALLPSQNRQLLDNTSQNESQRSILSGLIASDAQLTKMVTTNTPQHFNQSDQTFHGQCGRGTGLSPPQASMDIEPPIPSQPFNGPPFTGPFNSPPQVPRDIINTTGPSTSAVQPALVPPQHQSVPHQAPNNAPSPPQIQRCGRGPIGPLSLPELDMNKGAPLTSHTNTDNFEKNAALKRKLKQLYSRQHEIRDEIEYGESLLRKKPRMEATTWLAAVGKLRQDFPCTEAASEDCLPPSPQIVMAMQEAEYLMREGNFPNGLFEATETTASKLLEGKMMGEAFQRNTTKILECLAGNQVSRLGIYGMGGVGKTTIMMHIYNKLIENANYGNVLWVSMSHHFERRKLQEEIWKELKLETLQEKNERKVAAMLSDHLTKRGKSVIILDDVWEYFNLEEVGIPVRADGIKLVLTTRSNDVCCEMQCKEKIKIEPLSPKEAESLFLEELGFEMALDRETEVVMKSIVKECAGLPLGIITMARSMRGATDMFEWNDSLVTLEESSNAQTEMEKVLMTLKLSYDRLGRHDVQQCFLSCALYPEDKLISKFELVEFFIDQGLIGGLSTRKKQYDRGLTILNKLGHACLLEFQHESLMKMHDLIRDMALYIMSVTSIVKAGKGLTRIPSKEYWTNALEKVSLMENKISEFPSNMSPNCPKLSILLLNGCLSRNAAIPDSFFKNLLGLEVLNLSECKMRELPNSISDLVNLRVLLLRKCKKLQCIPYLGKLTSLKKLDARGCKNLKVLEGLEKLEDLRYLDLIETGIERLPKGTLDCLVYLQCLEVSVVSKEDITRLGALDIFGCYLENANDFNECVRVIEQSNPRYYNLNVDLEESKFIAEVSDGTQFGNLERRVDIRDRGHAIVSVGGECTGISILIPQDVQTMTMKKCNSITNLSSMGPLEYLEKLEIEDWENLETPCGGQDEEVNGIHDSPTPPHFPNLRVLKIYECPKLKYLCGHGSEFSLLHLRELRIGGCEEMVGIIAAVTSPQPYPLPFFPSLEGITIEKCNKMKRAVESEWMPHFPKLRSMIVSICDKMEEIIKGPPPYVPGEEISLESLNVFCCDNMRKLFSHEWLLHLRNLQNIYVDRCKGMVEMVSGAGQGQEGSIMTHVNNTLSSFQLPISLPKLKQLELYFLPQLKSICEVPISCDFMKELMVLACPELKGIPLQLRLHKIEEFPYITSEGEELAKMVVWDPPLIAMEGELLKTVMWDPPEAQAILQLTQRRVRF